MAHLITDWYYDLLDKGDPRVAGWLGMSSPFPTMFISLSYVVLVTRLGPSYMRNRKPYELRNVLIAYNAFQVVASILLWIEGGLAGWFTFYSYRCQPIDYSDDPYAVWMAKVTWYYYMLKFTELLDTVFFVLRKKNNQITTLHVVHHGIMPVSVWVGVKFLPGGGATFFGFLNTFVHIVMYSYYLLAALGPRVQPYLWWKKYLTQMQLIQFVLVIIHTIQTIILDCDKVVTKGLSILILAHGILFLGLFTNFYRQAYLNRAKANKMAETNKINDSKKKHPKHSNTTSVDGVRQRRVS